MSLERITGQRVVDELKAGHMVYMLQLADITSLTIADWLTGEFAIEEQPADLESPPPDPGPEKQPAKRKKLDWGKIQALHRAGWSYEKIADEMGTTVKTVATGLSKLRKKTENSVAPENDI